MPETPSGGIVLFDGICNLCNRWVDFVIRRDPRGRFRFAGMQADAGKRLLAERSLPTDTMPGVYLLRGARVYSKSGAVLRVAAGLKGLWPLWAAFLIVPPFLRDAVYDFIARRRYRWFGRRETCRLPTPGEKSRFLE